MKLKQIESILKRSKNVQIFEGGEGQWLGDGAALYPVYGMPYLTEENLLTMWDIPEDKRSSWYFRKLADISVLDLRDNIPGEHLIERTLFPICIKGATVEPLKTETGALFINVKYLRPFDDLENGYELYSRIGTDGTQYIAIKSGYSLVGIIMPMKIVNAEFIDNLETLLEYSRMTRSNERSAENILEDDDETD